MALTDPTGTITVTIRDNNGKTGLFQFGTGTTDPGDAVALINALVPLVAAVSDGAVLAASASFSQTETAPAPPPATSEIERRLVLVGRTETGAAVRYSVPSAAFTLESSAGTDRVPLTGPVLDLANYIRNNGRSAGDDEITAFTDAFISHRYRRPKK